MASASIDESAADGVHRHDAGGYECASRTRSDSLDHLRIAASVLILLAISLAGIAAAATRFVAERQSGRRRRRRESDLTARTEATRPPRMRPPWIVGGTSSPCCSRFRVDGQCSPRRHRHRPHQDLSRVEAGAARLASRIRTRDSHQHGALHREVGRRADDESDRVPVLDDRKPGGLSGNEARCARGNCGQVARSANTRASDRFRIRSPQVRNREVLAIRA
jgi:hypothetical protein